MKMLWVLTISTFQLISCHQFYRDCPTVPNQHRVVKVMLKLADHISENYLGINQLFPDPGDNEEAESYALDILNGEDAILNHTKGADVTAAFLYALKGLLACYDSGDAYQYSSSDKFGKRKFLNDVLLRQGFRRKKLLLRLGRLYREVLQAQKKKIGDNFNEKEKRIRGRLLYSKKKKQEKLAQLQREKEEAIKLMENDILSKIAFSLAITKDNDYEFFLKNFKKSKWDVFIKDLLECCPHYKIGAAIKRIGEIGLESQGIFLLKGDPTETDRIVVAINDGQDLDKLLSEADPIDIAAALIQSLKSHFEGWIDPQEALEIDKGDKKRQPEGVERLISRLAIGDIKVLCKLEDLLQQIVAKKDINLMAWEELVDVIGSQVIGNTPQLKKVYSPTQNLPQSMSVRGRLLTLLLNSAKRSCSRKN